MTTSRVPKSLRFAALALACSFAAPAALAADAVADSRGVHFAPGAVAPGYQLRVTGPAGYLFEQIFVDGDEMKATPAAEGWTDGAYRYEITPVTGMGKRPESDAGGLSSLARAPAPPAQSGAFVVIDGVVHTDDGEVESASGVQKNAVVDQDAGVTPRDQVIPDDLIVQGSICVGFDCINNENFGFDTIRMKENNTRIKFEDTSAGTFPSTDWQLTANDSASGGLNRFSIEDVTSATVPFTVEGAAATNSIYVDSTGRVGFRTAVPVLDLHVATSNTPGIRLEQTNAGGFTAQTWDVAGNEANFFVRDVTGGSRLPFRIRPGAPTSSIDVSGSGNVGVGTASPEAKLHVSGNDGSAQLLVKDTSAAISGRDLLRLENNGPTRFRMLNTATGLEWSMNAHNADFRLTPAGAATPAFTFFPNGNLTITGTLTQSSDRNSKTGFAALDHKALLAKVAALEITEWSFLAEPDGVRHIGPMAQDFHAQFGLGERQDRIAPLDTSGVALAAVQGLQKELAERDRMIAELTARVEALAEQGQRVEQLAQQMEQLLQPVAFAEVACEAPARNTGL